MFHPVSISQYPVVPPYTEQYVQPTKKKTTRWDVVAEDSHHSSTHHRKHRHSHSQSVTEHFTNSNSSIMQRHDSSVLNPVATPELPYPDPPVDNYSLFPTLFPDSEILQFPAAPAIGSTPQAYGSDLYSFSELPAVSQITQTFTANPIPVQTDPTYYLAFPAEPPELPTRVDPTPDLISSSSSDCSSEDSSRSNTDDEESEIESEAPEPSSLNATIVSCLNEASKIPMDSPSSEELSQPLIPTSGSRSRCLQALQTITDAELDRVLSGELQRPESVIRKERWVLSLYTQFCIRTNRLQVLPFDIPHLCAFVRFLSLYCHYALSGIEQIMIPALRRINVANQQTNDSTLMRCLNDTIKQLKHHPSVKKTGPGKPPLCSFDLSALITRIPQTLPTKALEASLFLFALHTGSRALTCENVLVGDIQQVEVDPTGLTCVVILLRVTKGNPRWDHPVTIEGYLTHEHPLDAVYWLNAYLKERYTLELPSLVESELAIPRDIGNQKLWPLSRDCMRERLKKRLEQAGFPTHRWAFHSLRSGFICSALLTAGSDLNKRSSVLETD